MMNLWSFLQQMWAPSGLKQSTTQYQWQPTLIAHDPNPPVALENPPAIVAISSWHQPEPLPPYSTRPRRDESVEPVTVIPFVPATVLLSSFWQRDTLPPSRMRTVPYEIAASPVFVPAPIPATVLPDSYWETETLPARTRMRPRDVTAPISFAGSTVLVTSWLQSETRPQRSLAANRADSAGPAFVPASTAQVTSWLQPEIRPQARTFSRFNDTALVPFVPAAAVSVPGSYAQADFVPSYRARPVPPESVAGPVLSLPTPPAQFVTAGQVPLLRNHMMAAVGPMRRQRKKPNKNGGWNG